MTKRIMSNLVLCIYVFYRAILRRARLWDCVSSVCLSVTFRYRDHISWNTSKIISRPISLRSSKSWPQHERSGPKGTPPKLGWNGLLMCEIMWGFDEAGSCSYTFWVGFWLAGGLFTSISGSVVLTSRELWVEPLLRPKEGEFPIVDREFVSR